MTKSSHKYKILYSEADVDVLASQAGQMQTAGYAVQQVVGRKAVEEALRHETFDLIILGPTLTRNDRHHLPYSAKKIQSGTRVLVMHTDGERHPYVDGNVDTGVDMQHWLDKIAAMFPAESAKAAGAGR